MSPTENATPQQDHDHALLTAANDTGWWDYHGRPAPWPDDFWQADGTINPDWQPNSHNPTEEPEPANPSENYNF